MFSRIVTSVAHPSVCHVCVSKSQSAGCSSRCVWSIRMKLWMALHTVAVRLARWILLPRLESLGEMQSGLFWQVPFHFLNLLCNAADCDVIFSAVVMSRAGWASLRWASLKTQSRRPSVYLFFCLPCSFSPHKHCKSPSLPLAHLTDVSFSVPGCVNLPQIIVCVWVPGFGVVTAVVTGCCPVGVMNRWASAASPSLLGARASHGRLSMPAKPSDTHTHIDPKRKYFGGNPLGVIHFPLHGFQHFSTKFIFVTAIVAFENEMWKGAWFAAIWRLMWGRPPIWFIG